MNVNQLRLQKYQVQSVDNFLFILSACHSSHHREHPAY